MALRWLGVPIGFDFENRGLAGRHLYPLVVRPGQAGAAGYRVDMGPVPQTQDVDEVLSSRFADLECNAASYGWARPVRPWGRRGGSDHVAARCAGSQQAAVPHGAVGLDLGSSFLCYEPVDIMGGVDMASLPSAYRDWVDAMRACGMDHVTNAFREKAASLFTSGGLKSREARHAWARSVVDP